VPLRQTVFEELCDLVNLDDTSKNAKMLCLEVSVTLGAHAAHQRWTKERPTLNSAWAEMKAAARPVQEAAKVLTSLTALARNEIRQAPNYRKERNAKPGERVVFTMDDERACEQITAALDRVCRDLPMIAAGIAEMVTVRRRGGVPPSWSPIERTVAELGDVFDTFYRIETGGGKDERATSQVRFVRCALSAGQMKCKRSVAAILHERAEFRRDVADAMKKNPVGPMMNDAQAARSINTIK
jgi:hypothetical protein